MCVGSFGLDLVAGTALDCGQDLGYVSSFSIVVVTSTLN